MAVTVGLRNPEGVRRHAQLAREVGATWEEILGSIMLTVPGHGLLPAVEAIPHARTRVRRSARSRTGVTVPDVEAAAPPFRILPKLDRPQPRLLDGRRARRAALLALPGLRLLHPSAAADLPDRPLEEPRRPRRCRAGRRSRRSRSTTRPWMPGPGAAVRRRDRRDRRAAVGAAHDEPRELPARRRSRSACRCG